MSRVRPAPTNSKRPTPNGQSVPSDLPVLLERIEAGTFRAAEVDAIERLMFDAIETLIARGTARKSAPAHFTDLPAPRHRDSSR